VSGLFFRQGDRSSKCINNPTCYISHTECPRHKKCQIKKLNKLNRNRTKMGMYRHNIPLWYASSVSHSANTSSHCFVFLSNTPPFPHPGQKKASSKKNCQLNYTSTYSPVPYSIIDISLNISDNKQTFIASIGLKAMSAKNSADAEAARYSDVRHTYAFSSPSKSA